jgi:hypothetical protein
MIKALKQNADTLKKQIESALNRIWNLPRETVTASNLNLMHEPDAKIQFVTGTVDFGEFDLLIFSEPDEDWQYDTLPPKGIELVSGLCDTLWMLFLWDASANKDGAGYALGFGEHYESNLSLPPTIDSVINEDSYDALSFKKLLTDFFTGRHTWISGPTYLTTVDDAKSLEQQLLRHCVQTLERSGDRPLNICVLGAVLEDNLLMLANFVADYTRDGTTITVPIDLCVRAQFYGEENQFLAGQ